MFEHRSLRWPITLGVLMFVILVALLVGWILLSVFGWDSKRAPLYITLLSTGSVFLTLAIVGTALYLTLSIKAINLSRRQSNFIDSVTHELKSPIASLKLYLQTLNRRNVPPQEQETFFKDMLEDVERLDQLINHLLDVARIEKDRAAPPSEDLRLDDVIKSCVGSVCERYQQAAETIELATPPAVVHASRVDLELIFRNLIDNGMKYANEEDPRVSIGIEPDGANTLLIRVADNGRGIPLSLRHLVFGRFVRLGSELEREKPGTGLGLYIVRTMIGRLGGKIRIRDREPGPGTVFEVQLPGKLIEGRSGNGRQRNQESHE
jgi:two-component system phosphate regulon sensor histidine kinase PhoR